MSASTCTSELSCPDDRVVLQHLDLGDGHAVRTDGEGLEEPVVVGALVGKGVGVGIDLHQRVVFRAEGRVVLQHLGLGDGHAVRADSEGLEEPVVVGALVGEGVGVGIDLHQRVVFPFDRVVLQHLDLDLLRACGTRAEQQGGGEDKNVLRE